MLQFWLFSELLVNISQFCHFFFLGISVFFKSSNLNLHLTILPFFFRTLRISLNLHNLKIAKKKKKSEWRDKVAVSSVIFLYCGGNKLPLIDLCEKQTEMLFSETDRCWRKNKHLLLCFTGKYHQMVLEEHESIFIFRWTLALTHSPSVTASTSHQTSGPFLTEAYTYGSGKKRWEMEIRKT